MTSAVQQGDQSKVTFQEINIALLHESKHNPRRHFDGHAMEELVASIQQMGIIAPLVVRPNQKGYEIAAGHRRYRAAKQAKLETLPCRVLDLTDQQFMEIITIENLQREDVHPLDEAKGYEALMAAPYKMKVEVVAQKVGKSVKYVYDRIKLLALCKPAQDFFFSGRIAAGHAILLARLSHADQLKAIGSKADMYCDGGVFEAEKGLPYESDIPEEEQFKAVSVRELAAWIDDHVRFDRRVVDPMLFPETAEKIQAECKTTEMEVKKAVVPITYEFVLNDDTRDKGERTYTSRSWKRADGKDGSKTCEYAMLGCVVAGAHRGESFDVCVDKKVCKIHWKDEVKAAEARAKGHTGKATKAESKLDRARQQQNDEFERRKRKRAEWATRTPAVLQAIDATLPSISAKATGPLGDQLVKAFSDWGRAKTSVPRGKTAEDLVRHLAGLYLCRVAHEYDAYETVPKLAKQLGVDLTTILKPEVHTSGQKKGKAA